MSFMEALQVVTDDLSRDQPKISTKESINLFLGLLVHLFKSINTKGLLEPFKTDNHNIVELYRVLEDYLIKTEKGNIFDFHFMKVSY